MLWDLYGLSLTAQEEKATASTISTRVVSPLVERDVRKKSFLAHFSYPSAALLLRTLKKKVRLRRSSISDTF